MRPVLDSILCLQYWLLCTATLSGMPADIEVYSFCLVTYTEENVLHILHLHLFFKPSKQLKNQYKLKLC